MTFYRDNSPPRDEDNCDSYRPPPMTAEEEADFRRELRSAGLSSYEIDHEIAYLKRWGTWSPE